jgi:serine/threonine protein kinase
MAIELIKVDLEHRWQRGLRRLIEDYQSDIPDIGNLISGPLIFEEYHARKQAEDPVTPDEYYQRFPEFSAELKQLFRVDPSDRSTFLTGPSTVPTLTAGESIDDFDLLLRLGQGAFATVFLARQRSMHRLVAVKVSSDHGTEPQTLAQLDHNNIVRVYDQRRLPERGLRLLYMQYASGGTLAGVIDHFRNAPRAQWHGRLYLKAIDAVLDRHGETPPSESGLRRKLAGMTWPQVVAWIGTQLAQALQSAHQMGVLHRDLKPANVLLTAEGVPKLADFNISFSANLAGSSPAAYFGGSLAYMSPEQLEACNPRHDRQADTLDGRSDQYSLGVLLWELLTGHRPFEDDTAHSKWDSQLDVMTTIRRRGPAPGIARTVYFPEVPGLSHVLVQCLSPNVDDRFSSGLELAREFELCLQPDARRLIRTGDSGWRRLALKYPLTTVSIITVIPNLVAAIFNFIYNHGEIEDRLPDAIPTFMRVQTIINVIAFPTGASCAGWRGRLPRP